MRLIADVAELQTRQIEGLVPYQGLGVQVPPSAVWADG
jgi:hypothetical protein